MTDVRGDTQRPGEYRETQNMIGRTSNIHQARYVPPPHLKLPALLTDLEKLMNEDDEKCPTLVRIALAHYQFEAIHPFRDGNGRIGRLLVMLMMVREKLLPDALLPLSKAFDRRKTEYVDSLLRVSKEGDWTGWLQFFFESVIESADDALHSSRCAR